VRERVIAANPAADLDHDPRRDKGRNDDARLNCWTGEEAKTFLETAKTAGPQAGAFYALALDGGLRKGELCELRWSDVDFDASSVWVVRQFTKPPPAPTFGPTKSGTTRRVDIAPETLELLRAHKRAQAELKMANRTTYKDFGLVFAKEYGDVTNRKDMIGLPLQSNNLTERQFAKLVKVAKVKPITFPWNAAHLRDAATAGRKTDSWGLAATGPLQGGDHPGDLRPRIARAADGRGGHDGRPPRVAVR